MAHPAPLPLIVCGFSRSGTRMCADILKNSSDVALQGEMEEAERTLGYLRLMKDRFAGLNEKRRFAWSKKEYAFYFSVFAGASNASAVLKPDARYDGHKTPLHERFFDDYEYLFDRPGAQPRYVYCLRDPREVWRSYKAMPWGKRRNVGDFIVAWARSVERYERMATEAPGRVFLMNLNAMLRAPDQLEYLREAFLDGLGVAPSTFQRPLDALANTNSTAAKYGAPAPELDPHESARIARDRRLTPVMERHFPWAV